MAIDIKAITCPQCGSSDVEMKSETFGTCKTCGAQFTVQRSDGGSHPDGPSAQEEKNECRKGQITPEYTKEQFLRKVWLTLAEEDVPLEVYSENFGEVKEIPHQVLFHKIRVDVACQASIGYDRQEQYTDYETYYEDVPYTAYEKQYNVDIHDFEEKPVTKYRKVAKQRAVTKYKTVTDWSAWNGRHSTKSLAIKENLKGCSFDEALFADSFCGMKDSSLGPVDEATAAKMEISKEALDRANSEHSDNITRSVAGALPGDHYRDLDWQVQRGSEESSLYNAVEYAAVIHYNGKDYTKYAFPFGPMQIGGDKIENPLSLDEAVAGMENKLYDFKKERNSAIESSVAKTSAPLAYATIALLVVSILVSLFIRSTFLVVIMLIAAVAAFVLCELAIRRSTSTETTKAKEEIAAEEARVQNEVDNYSAIYKEKQLAALNGRLQSLGFEPATADEL